MNLAEIIDTLLADAEEENSDHEKYMKLYEALEEKFPDKGYGCIIRDIAEEESLHRCHIQHILKELGADDDGTVLPDKPNMTKDRR